MIDKKFDVLIGIDTGVTTGFAVYSRPLKKLTQLASYQIHKAMEEVTQWHQFAGDRLYVRVEDARLRTWVPHVAVKYGNKGERGRAAGAGSIKRDAQIWEDFLKHHGIAYEMVAPKYNKTKLNQEAFKSITKWQEKTNNHERDAGMLIFGS